MVDPRRSRSPRRRLAPSLLSAGALALLALGALADTAAGAGAHPATRTSGLSTPAIVLAALAAVLALGCVAWAVARMEAFEPRWTLSLRHSLAEATFRASATWTEFTDWARLGR